MWLGFSGLLLGQLLGSGLLQVALKFALYDFPPILLSSIRFIVAAIGISLLIRVSGRSFAGKQTLSLIKRSLFFAGNICFYAIGLQYTTVIMAQIIGSIVPIIVIVMSYFVLGEKLTRNKIIGLCIAITGLGFLIYQSIAGAQHLSLGSPIGNIFILTASCCWSTYLVFSKKISDQHSTARITLMNFIFTAIALSLLAPFEFAFRPVSFSHISISGVIGLSVLSFGTIVQYVVIQYGIKHTTAATASFFQYLGPFIGAVFAIPLLHEHITLNLIAGGALILMGVFYATTYSHVKRSFVSMLQ